MEAKAYIQTNFVDAGLAEAMAHALDEIAPTLLDEGGLDDTFKASFASFSSLFTVVGHVCPTFLTRFRVAPVTARNAAFDVLAFVITVIMKDGTHNFWNMIIPKLIGVVEDNPATAAELDARLNAGVFPGLFVHGEWVQIWNYENEGEGEDEDEGEDEGEDDESAWGEE
jgi:hypothetical protein